jgi:hypothetical protein
MFPAVLIGGLLPIYLPLILIAVGFVVRNAKVLLIGCYVGVGISMTIHWFSDFVAGTIIGSVIGDVVGKSFAEKTSNPNIQRPTSGEN